MVLEHCDTCNTCIDTYQFYGDDQQFLLDCETCNKSYCIECSRNHIYFVYWKEPRYLRARVKDLAKMLLSATFQGILRNEQSSTSR